MTKPRRNPGRYGYQFRPSFSQIHEDRDLFWVVPFSVRYMVGITGPRFAGKSLALAYLAEAKGFETYSLTATLRGIAVQRGIPLDSRLGLRDLGNELRVQHDDPAYLARLTLRHIHRDHLDHRGRIEAPCRIAVGGFKRPEELKLFEGLTQFQQLNIDAPETVRHDRAQATGLQAREINALKELPEFSGIEALEEENSFAAFQQGIEAQDLHDSSKSLWTRGYGQAVEEVIKSPSRKTVDNNGDILDLHEALDKRVTALDALHRGGNAQ